MLNIDRELRTLTALSHYVAIAMYSSLMQLASYSVLYTELYRVKQSYTKILGIAI